MEVGKMQMKPVRLMAAACNGMGIGKDGHIPWNLPKEFKFFLDKISSVNQSGKLNMLIWGRLCWQSHPKSTLPLPNTIHVVLSNTLSAVPEHAHYVLPDLDSACNLAGQYPLSELIETIWVIGGPEVYKSAMAHPWCDLIYLTDIMADFDCDIFFPDFDKDEFKEQEGFHDIEHEIQEENGIKYKFQVFKREIKDAE
ncbi:dihydrofolate reductase-like [Synchiropus splendidus]|uniref:dihydrofolate reductase-like n=1 Tax=Synchiropus splendidus TaxID=270530 RepID=UPI00237D7392|nr:dihydrofolate reductase-like [Synchiropus splendidus]